MDKKVKIGLIGAGDHMRNHMTGFEGISNFEIVAIADPNKENIEKILQVSTIDAQNIKVFAESQSMLENAQIDAIISATPDRFHLSDIQNALKYKKHLLIEKPLVATSGELDDLVSALKGYQENGLVLSSCHPRRFDLPQIGLKDMLGELTKELGKVMGFFYDFSYVTLKRRGLHEGLLVDHFNHEIDLLNFLFGFQDFQAHKLFDTEERYTATGVRGDGITFHFSGTRFLDASSKNYPEFMHLRFEKGEVTVETKTGKVYIKNHETSVYRETQVQETDYVERLRRVNANFIQSILGNELPYLTFQEMLLNTSSALTLSSKGYYNSKHDTYMEQLHKVAEGSYKNAKWELIKGYPIPDIESTSAVISLITTPDGKIFLSKNNDLKKDRGWDLPGGHVDAGETLEQAGKREVYEEAGIQVKNYQFVGYIKLTSPEAMPKRSGGFYPNPGYMAFYRGELDGEIGIPTGEEIERSQAFDIPQALEMIASDMDTAAIQFLLK